MSELKPDSEKKEERLSDKEKVNTEKINAEEINGIDTLLARTSLIKVSQ